MDQAMVEVFKNKLCYSFLPEKKTFWEQVHWLWVADNFLYIIWWGHDIP